MKHPTHIPKALEPVFDATPTAPRFTLADHGIERLDVVDGHNTRPRRMLVYPTPSPEKAEIREHILERGLLLGGSRGHDKSGFEVWGIPLSARSISHEAATEAEGVYAYNDRNMFTDLGTLLGALALEGGEKPYMLDEVIGRNIAVVEFTRVREQKTLLIPGFETQIKHANSKEQALSGYGKRLSKEFGQQFDRHASDFLQAFNQERR